jgi:hypothetical protein
VTKEERIAEIKWTQEHQHPHGCGDRGYGALCHQELDGTCKLESCDYYGLTASETRLSNP